MSAPAFISSAVSDVGCRRELNEDACLDRDDLGLWVVADGMGGHEAGDLASQTIVAALDFPDEQGTPRDLIERIEDTLIAVNSVLMKKARSIGPDAVVASTVVGLVLAGGHFACFWAGDSRAYVVRDSVALQLTRDDSHVQMLIDAGELDEAQARRHPSSTIRDSFSDKRAKCAPDIRIGWGMSQPSSSSGAMGDPPGPEPSSRSIEPTMRAPRTRTPGPTSGHGAAPVIAGKRNIKRRMTKARTCLSAASERSAASPATAAVTTRFSGAVSSASDFSKSTGTAVEPKLVKFALAPSTNLVTLSVSVTDTGAAPAGLTVAGALGAGLVGIGWALGRSVEVIWSVGMARGRGGATSGGAASALAGWASAGSFGSLGAGSIFLV